MGRPISCSKNIKQSNKRSGTCSSWPYNDKALLEVASGIEGPRERISMHACESLFCPHIYIFQYFLVGVHIFQFEKEGFILFLYIYTRIKIYLPEGSLDSIFLGGSMLIINNKYLVSKPFFLQIYLYYVG